MKQIAIIPNLIIYYLFLVVPNPNSLIAQEITYVGGGVFSAYYLEFTDGENFREWRYSCVTTHYGRGTYCIVDNKITFEYDDPPPYLDRVWIEKIEDLKDSVELDIIVRDYETNELLDNFRVYHNGPGKVVMCERIPFYGENIYEVSVRRNKRYRYKSQLFEISKPGKYYIEVNLLYGLPLEGSETFELKYMNADSLQFADQSPYYRIRKK